MSFLRSVFSVSALTVVGRITGYMRDLLMVNLIGANAISDALVIAIKIPSFFRRIFAEGAFHVSFLPAYTHAQKSKVFAGMVLSLLICALGFGVLAIECFYGPLSEMLLTKIHPETLKYAQQFGPVTFPYIFFISIVSFFGSILNAHGRFSALAISQAIGNITVILFVWTLAGWTTQTGLLFSWGILLSGAIQCVFIIWNCWKKGLLIALQWPQWTPDIKRFLKRFFPGLLSVSAVQINALIVPLYFAGRLPVGSLSYLQYADRLNQLPLSIIGIALSSVLLPMIAEKIKENDGDGANAMLSQALQFAWIVTIPFLILLSCCAHPLVTTLFGNSKLNIAQLGAISDTVMIYALGIPAYIFIKIFNARFFAARDTITPLIGGVVSAVTDVALALIFVSQMGHLAIALAASLSSWLNALFLIYRLIARDRWVFTRSLKIFYAKTALAGLLSAAAVLLVRTGIGPFETFVWWVKILYIGVLLGTCGATFILALWQLRIFSWASIQKTILSFGKKTP
jgi:putative peptidoglycan lipid II flippase